MFFEEDGAVRLRPPDLRGPVFDVLELRKSSQKLAVLTAAIRSRCTFFSSKRCLVNDADPLAPLPHVIQSLRIRAE